LHTHTHTIKTCRTFTVGLYTARPFLGTPLDIAGLQRAGLTNAGPCSEKKSWGPPIYDRMAAPNELMHTVVLTFGKSDTSWFLVLVIRVSNRTEFLAHMCGGPQKCVCVCVGWRCSTEHLLNPAVKLHGHKRTTLPDLTLDFWRTRLYTGMLSITSWHRRTRDFTMEGVNVVGERVGVLETSRSKM